MKKVYVCQKRENTDGGPHVENLEGAGRMQEQAKRILALLRNPIECGVYYQRAIIEGQHIQNLWKYLKNYSKRNRKNFTVDEPILNFDRDEMDEIGEASKWWLTQSMEEMLNFIVRLKTCPAPIKEWAKCGNAILVPEYAEQVKGEYYFLAQKAYIPETLDAFSIEIEPRAYPNLVIDVISLTPAVLGKFRDFVASIPIVGEKAVFIREQRKHATKYASVLYPSVAALWIDYIARLTVSEDVVGLLESAVDYFYTRDWRTSIVFSAISVEKTLAELYEEIFKKSCPPIPIGAILKQISGVKKLPKEVENALKTANKMRNTAVHRSYMPLTVNEATDALKGAVSFTLWFYEHGPEFCAP
jgi:hypothetical protein